MGRTEFLTRTRLRASLGWKGRTFNESEMARFSKCTDQCASKVLDTADIVRDAIFQQPSFLSASGGCSGKRISLRDQRTVSKKARISRSTSASFDRKRQHGNAMYAGWVRSGVESGESSGCWGQGPFLRAHDCQP